MSRVDPLVAALGLSCPSACGILIPRPGIKATSPALQGQFLATGSPGESHGTDFGNVFSSLFGVDFFHHWPKEDTEYGKRYGQSLPTASSCSCLGVSLVHFLSHPSSDRSAGTKCVCPRGVRVVPGDKGRFWLERTLWRESPFCVIFWGLTLMQGRGGEGALEVSWLGEMVWGMECTPVCSSCHLSLVKKRMGKTGALARPQGTSACEKLTPSLGSKWDWK